jgi:hypothetical protein
MLFSHFNLFVAFYHLQQLAIEKRKQEFIAARQKQLEEELLKKQTLKEKLEKYTKKNWVSRIHLCDAYYVQSVTKCKIM